MAAFSFGNGESVPHGRKDMSEELKERTEASCLDKNTPSPFPMGRNPPVFEDQVPKQKSMFPSGPVEMGGHNRRSGP